MPRVRVFISSREEELADEREIVAEVVKSLRMDPFLAEVDLPPARQKTEEYLKELEQSQILILLLWRSLKDGPKDKGITWKPPVKKELERAIKRSIPYLVFEKRIVRKEHRDPDVKNLLESIMAAGVNVAPFREESELKEEARKGFLHLLQQRFIERPIFVDKYRTIYDIATEVMKTAKERVYFVQKTPLLLLGPRNYDYEIKGYDVIYQWFCDVNTGQNDKKLIQLYSYSEVRQVLEREPLEVIDEYPYLIKLNIESDDEPQVFREELTSKRIKECIESRIHYFKEAERNSKGRFTISSIESLAGLLAIVDNTCAWYIHVADKGFMSIYEDYSIAELLAGELDELLRRTRKTAESLIRELYV